MNEHKLSRTVYTLFLGVFIAVFAAVSIRVLYEAPSQPDYTVAPPSDQSIETLQQYQYELEIQKKQYENEQNIYSHNVSILALFAATVLVVVSVMLESRYKIAAHSVLMGGFLTYFYSIVRSLQADGPRLTLAIATVGLLAALFVGYRHFILSKIRSKWKLPWGRR